MKGNSDFAEQVASAVIRGVNRLNRIRDSLYLDTCAWSNLAKGLYDAAPIKQWCRENSTYVWLSRFQLAELSADTRLARPLGLVLQQLDAVVVDREVNEFTGEPWYKVKESLVMPLNLNSDTAIDAFVEMMISGPIRGANYQLKSDGEAFRQLIDDMLARVPSDRKRSWADFPDALRRWIENRCAGVGEKVHPDGLIDPNRYVGLKLSFGVIFHRYYLSGKTWKTSDYVDYLHSSDMAYARTVVTEAGLTESIRQVTQRITGIGPEAVHNLSWLQAPI
jgi:hypothetical protein